MSINVVACIEQTCKTYKDKALFGWRDKNGEFVWPVSYSLFWKISQGIALELLKLIPPNVKLIPMENAVPAVAIISIANRMEWMATDVACGIAGLLVVGIHPQWSTDDIKHVCSTTGVVIVVADKTSKRLFEACKLDSLIYIDMDDISEDKYADLNNAQLDERINLLKSNLKLNNCPYHTVIFSSGTSGRPKGFGLTKEKWSSEAENMSMEIEFPDRADVTLASFSPWAHGFDRGLCWQGMVAGDHIGFARTGNEKAFFEDIADIQPGLFAALTSTFNKLYGMYQQLVHANLKALMLETLSADTDSSAAASVGLFKMLTALVLNSHRLSDGQAGKETLKHPSPTPSSSSSSSSSSFSSSPSSPSSSSSPSSLFLLASPEADADIFAVIHQVRRNAINRMRAIFKYTPGSHSFRFFGTGGAILSPEVLRFVQLLFPGVAMVNVYGSTETFFTTPGLAFNEKINHRAKIRLDDVPELGYTSNDKPFPRGEIWARVPNQTIGYWGYPYDPEATALTERAFVKEEGTDLYWFKTGDIGEMDVANNTLRIIDRRTQMGSLYYQGREVFIPIAAREALYGNALGLRVCIHTDRTEGRLVAIVEVKRSQNAPTDAPSISSVTPNPCLGETGEGGGGGKGQQKETHEEALLQLIKNAALKEGSFPDAPTIPFLLNVPVAVVCSPYEWGVENGMVSITGKLQHAQIYKAHEKELQTAYAYAKTENKL